MLSADYGYIGDGDIIGILVVHVKPHGAIFACVADGNGPTPYIVRMLSQWIRMCGLVNFLYRSDLESSIVRLIEDAIAESGRQGTPMNDEQLERDREEDRLLDPCDEPEPRATLTALPEHSGVGESQSNGAVEKAVQMVKNQLVTLKLALEDRLSWEIPLDHPIIHWLIHHAAYVLTRVVPGENGLTQYQRMHGRTSMDRIAEFGERVLFFVPAKRRRSLEPKWRNGIFIGRAWGERSELRCSA